MAKTYSLEAYDSWFNCLSMLVATEVCRVSARAGWVPRWARWAPWRVSSWPLNLGVGL